MNSRLKKAGWRIAAAAGWQRRFARRCGPAALRLTLAAVRSDADSPFAKWMTDMRAEATGTWAIAGCVIGLVIGLWGVKFGGHEAKGKMVTLTIISFALLSVEAIVAYLQGE